MSQRTLCVVFDLDDTLYPEREHALSGFRAASRWAKAELGLADLDQDMARLLDAGHLGQLFKLVLVERMGPDGEQHAERLITAYREHHPEISLFDDADWALGHYERQGPIALITDGRHEMQQRKVRALELEHRFLSIVYTGAFGGREFHKPHPRSYEATEAAYAAHLGRPAEALQFVYVGDNPTKDFVTPNARGWISIYVERPEGIHHGKGVAEGGAPQHELTTLRELPEVLGF